MPLPQRQTAEAEQRPRKHPSCSPDIGIGGVKSVGGHVLNDIAQNLQHGFRLAMAGIESAKSMGQLAKANRRMIANPKPQEVVDFNRRAAMENIEIDGCIQQKGRADRRLSGSPHEFVVRAPRKPERWPLWPRHPDRVVKIKTQDRRLAEWRPCGARV
jgi:hypothetical protein